jgi:hypothetical protein
MKVTKQLRSAIHQAVRDNVRGAAPLAEVGIRDYEHLEHSLNALDWPEDSDESYGLDFIPVRDLREIPDADLVELDLYVTTGVGYHRELETNVSVFIRGGQVVGAAGDVDSIARLYAELTKKAS